MWRRSAVPLIASMCLSMCLVLSPGVAAAANPEATFTPGAPGIGDPYFPLDGNGGYDVVHYGLDVRYDPATDVLSGVATIRARSTQDLSRFDLDLQGLTVRAVTVDERAASWSRDGQELVVTPAHGLRKGRHFTVTVTYDGVPQTIHDELGISGFMHTDDGAVVAGEPHGAAYWFPSDDHPRDAASVDVTATVPAGLQAVSNGVLRGQRTEDGWSTWSWHAAEPMATYLVTLAIGRFDVQERTVDGVRYWDAVDPDLATLDLDPSAPGPTVGEVVAGSLAREPEFLAFLSGRFGRYPFRASGGIVDDTVDLGFALETQTRPVYSPLFFTDPAAGDTVFVHELAHQWYGDLVRVDLWRDVWLNEGFATYAEWLWGEHEGLTTPQQEFDKIASQASPAFWQTTVVDPGSRTDRLFGAPVYYRGAMTLQALRKTVGDDAFFRILRTWAASHAGRTGTTEQFTSLAERISGQHLGDLFRIWLYTPQKPAELG